MFVTTNPLTGYLKAAGYTLVAAAIGFGVYKVWTFADKKIDQGVQIGKTEAKVETLEQDKVDLTAIQTELQKAATTAAKAQEKYGETQEQYRALSDRLAAQQRMHNSAVKDLNTRIGQAGLESCRDFAKDAADNLSRCRGHVERFGQEAVRSSAAAHAAVAAAGDLVTGIPEVEVPEVAIPEVEIPETTPQKTGASQ